MSCRRLPAGRQFGSEAQEFTKQHAWQLRISAVANFLGRMQGAWWTLRLQHAS
jgi:hypothetical protein